MRAYVALLRAVNVGGTGKLPMTELAQMATDAGFSQVKTYIASGNLVFATDRDAAEVKETLESRLQGYFGKPCAVFVRTAPELNAVLAANPFTNTPPNFTQVMFLDGVPPADAIETVRGRDDEQIALGAREIYVAYPRGMGKSKLRIPAGERGTGRNLNTVVKLAALATDRD